jgi:diguanylate cyclase (GGDEF)-like protein
MAMRDDLTQLFNRRYFFERLERELQTAKGFQRPLSVLLIDMDSLKELNDTYGHRAGDIALEAFGRFLLQQTRASDVPARIGGDEFAVILPDTNETQANVMIERLTKALEKTDLVDDEKISLQLGASLGLAGYPWCGEDADTLVQKADAAMYAMKHARKNAAKREAAAVAADVAS